MVTLLAPPSTRTLRRQAPLRDLLWKVCRDSDPKANPGKGFIPTGAQKAILDDDHLEVLISGGFRGGKSRVGSRLASDLILAFIAEYGERAAGQTAWLVGADYERTRAEFDHPEGSLETDFTAAGILKEKTKRIDPGQIELYVTWRDDKDEPRVASRPFLVKTKSAADETSLGMESPILILVCEAAHVTHDVYLRLRSRVSEARARYPGYGVLILEGTMESGLGWFPSLYTLWQAPSVQERLNVKSYNLPSRSNQFLYPGGAQDPEILALQAALPPDLYLERHEGVPSPPRGRVHSDFSPAIHVKQVAYDSALPVYLGIDPGYSGQPSHYAVEACQKVDGQWRVFWEFWKSGYTAEQVCDAVTSQWWWANPLKTGVIDIAGAAHAGAMESNVEVWFKKTGLICMNMKVNVLPGIDKFNSVLKVNPLTGEPRLVIDPSCLGVISELGGAMPPDSNSGEREEMNQTRQMRVYSWQKDHEGNTVGKVPKDAHCDGVKALTYLMVATEGYTMAHGRQRAQQRGWRDRKSA